MSNSFMPSTPFMGVRILVAHGRQEIALGLAGGLGHLLGELQLFGTRSHLLFQMISLF